ncbi:imidazoleglycerol-phosphate dehydratase HisB [Clostridium sartagoforme]|uniref:Imidazoleglycerol-phosphate dehydratase n=1 Tax=Clostridium sartagoforme TaxID=84031 RepID=A0A4S2DKB2_9CLOT|nr:imidazoleglycerol-phosphate dehydratase HisB [Clostridium sartagoforme]TGY42676.1 imidazoleglycerol-phosphate dehydratase HisB [Clostridium sartagoforme]
MSRVSKINRETKETKIKLSIDVDGKGNNSINTPVGFLNHMLTLFAFHSGIDINLEASGDIEVCDHHIVEDIGISLGKALNEALGNKAGINRYGTAFVPMDEALCQVVLDLSGRGFLHFDGEFKREQIGNFSTEMVVEFFRAVAMNFNGTVHIRVLYGVNDHHKIEGIFKAFGRALKEAVTIGNDANKVLSTKGTLSI